MEEDWEEDEEEIEKIEEEADEICSRATSCEDCPWEVCGDLWEILCQEEERNWKRTWISIKRSKVRKND